MSLRESIHHYFQQRTIEEMCQIAANEIDRGGSLNVEVGRGNEREFLNLTSKNLSDGLPRLLSILVNPGETGKDIKFTILNKERQKTDGFNGKIKMKKPLS